MMLHTEPSFSVYADADVFLDSNTIGDLKVKQGSGEFSFANDEDGSSRFSGFENLGIQKEDQQIESVGINGKQTSFDQTVDEDPSNPVFLKNHAHLLLSNGDLNGAEEYYLRVTQTDANDGESLMQYAKLVWELHGDKNRASAYLERAVHAAPQDCNVLAAYASFLWEIDEDEENDEATTLVEQSLEVEERPGILGVEAVEEYYKSMVNKNRGDSLLLSNYARYLQQTKGDLEGAEEYYSRAIQADGEDGEVISEYAQLVWELHRDQHKAASYFERAVEAAPANSHVLAAYAKFLWEVEGEDGDE
ncbi:uncharacterized protein LOC112519011 [Cynara cardunculus var. scolymus]|uniref:uncharacterized protein LOC112519011 n=1 Tax=Cynara cardunculus var. scolymus TaxID=59895 RepID=UPI000D6252EF|nr:uncharacterized protein LOC112519011 [Cynara cardunculus var. scolymus]